MTNKPKPSGDIPWGEGALYPCVPVDDHKLQTVMNVAAVRQAVLDPITLEDPKVLAADASKRAVAEVRSKVQRSVTQQKKTNIAMYGQYILGGFRGERDLWDIPTMQLFREAPLELYELPDGKGTGFLLRPGEFLVNTDGETQRLALDWAASREPQIEQMRVAITIAHGRTIPWARQVFHDFNVLGVRPNVAVGISMDSSDPATRIARELEEASPILKNRVMQTGRQLGRNSHEVMTVSALRSAVVTTLLGRPGLGLGARPVGDKLQGIDHDTVQKAVLDVWVPLLDTLAPELNRHLETVVGSPVIMAALGVLAHRTMPNPPRSLSTPQMSPTDVLDRISDIRWDRKLRQNGHELTPWENVAGKTTASGKFSVGGIKEYGHAVSEALEDRTIRSGKQIRLLEPSAADAS